MSNTGDAFDLTIAVVAMGGVLFSILTTLFAVSKMFFPSSSPIILIKTAEDVRQSAAENFISDHDTVLSLNFSSGLIRADSFITVSCVIIGIADTIAAACVTLFSLLRVVESKNEAIAGTIPIFYHRASQLAALYGMKFMTGESLCPNLMS